MTRWFSAMCYATAILFAGCSNDVNSGKSSDPPGQTPDLAHSSVRPDPPECGCCVIRDAPAGLSHRAKLFPERTGVERVRIRGGVFASDGKTPARDAILYFYHTDETGSYTKRGDEPRDSFAWWHGKHRGWLNTNERGEYEIDSVKPAPYPDRSEPAHIHATIKSPLQKHCYNIADFVFQNDELLTAEFWNNTERYWRSLGIYQDPNYGGVRLVKNADGVWEGVRNITLVPEFDVPKTVSGRDILDESPAFEPQHAWGPDKGSHACPMCKYGYQPGVLFWVNSDANPGQVEKWATCLEELSVERGDKNFKAYLIYTNPANLSREQLETKLAAFGLQLNLKKVAVTYVPSATDKATDTHLNKINPATENTVIVYNNRKVVDKFVNLEFTEQNVALLKSAVKRAGTDKELYAVKPSERSDAEPSAAAGGGA